MTQPEQIIEKLYSDNTWGTYYANRYYFSINTTRTRIEAGLSETKYELTEQEQMALQYENLPAFFHEYLHYIQETSTIAGHSVMLNNILMKAIFTSYRSTDIGSSESLGVMSNPEHAEKFANAALTNSRIDGSGKLDFKMRSITKIGLEEVEMHFPTAPIGKQSGKVKVPKIRYAGFDNGRPAINEIFLGRFYLYESLAYELDQILERRQKRLSRITDPHIGTEYTVCRMVAQYIFPLIRQEIAMAAALLALQHIDAGNAFLTILQNLATGEMNGTSQDDTISRIKHSVSNTLTMQRENFFAQQDLYTGLFAGRIGLEKAYTYIAEINKQLYDLRISNPCFELDWVLNEEYDRILENAQMCDYLYIFKNSEIENGDPEFFRDFMATLLPEETCQALKVLIAFDHYFFAHLGMPTSRVEQNPKPSHQCPFFTCCDLQERAKHRDLCKTKPWRVYEILQPQRKHCWYSQGVMESKGKNR
jgi:hypothetical protein